MILRPTDIHNHILPGVDDGFRTVSDSREALTLLKENGVNEVVFTPHLNPEQFPESNEESLREHYREFVAQIPQSLDIKTSLAAEYMIVGGFEERVKNNPGTLLCWPDKTILIEMSYFYRSLNLEEAVMELVLAGFKPILAHPERYLYMADCLEDFDTLRASGCRFQTSYMSLMGVYGSRSLKIIKYLAQRGWCDFFATDLHSVHQLHSILEGKPALGLRWPRKVVEI